MTEGMGGERVIVGGRYELGELLGRGGMAEVRKGTDIRLGRVVAVKRLRPDLAEDPVFQARFRREAQSAASLNHPAIVAVYDTGEEPMGDGVHAQPYIVMEYVTGRTLRDILREGRKILPERALEIAAGVLSALDYSHRSGIIHRDIKPANVMLTPSGEVKVMDFGIARALTDSSTGMTQTAAVVGTAQYLSPEQARGETVDSRSDVYSTGCLLYELLTGRPPFTGESPGVGRLPARAGAAPAPSMLMPDLSSDIDAIVMKALAKPIDQRYQSAAQMRADIERHLAGLPVLAPPAPAVVEPEPVHPPQDSTTIFAPDLHGVEEREERGGRGRWAFWILLVVMLGLVAAAVFAALSLFKTPPPTVIVPTVTNLTLSQAQSALAPNLSVGQVTNQPSTDVPAGLVISQSPLPGTPVDPDSTVDLVVSSGPDTVAVPNILGYSRTEAQAALETEGLGGGSAETAVRQPEGDGHQHRAPGGAEGRQGLHGDRLLVGRPEDHPRSHRADRGRGSRHLGEPWIRSGRPLRHEHPGRAGDRRRAGSDGRRHGSSGHDGGDLRDRHASTHHDHGSSTHHDHGSSTHDDHGRPVNAATARRRPGPR